jgi:NodT family efflux transporter outer membrane factor (OMF) lipoprotein
MAHWPAPHLRSLLKHIAIPFAMAALAGCAVGPDFVAPPPPSEQTYLPHGAATFGAVAPGEPTQRLANGQPLQVDWWTRLGSPELNETVQMALDNNWSLAAARANLAKGGQMVQAASGGLYPQIDALGSLERRAYGPYFLGPSAFTFPTFSAYTGGIGVSYDLDIFGGTHRRIELAAADAEVQAEALNAAKLAVASGTVLTALEIASTRANIAAVNDVIASDQKTLDLVLAARRIGVASEMDVTSSQSQLDRDRAQQPKLQQALDMAQDALAVLAGKSPALWTAPAFDLDRITLPDELPLVVPSELVRARPDIRAAEAQLRAANAEVGIATADLYPRINLAAAFAEEGLTSGPSESAWSLIGGLTAPIFHGGSLTAQRHAAEDAYQAAFAQYQQTVLTAFQQVADNLHGLTNSVDDVGTERQALDSANSALSLTRLGYGVGNAGIVQILDAQRLQQLAELNLIEARARRYVQTVNLFVATGGGLMAANREPAQ